MVTWFTSLSISDWNAIISAVLGLSLGVLGLSGVGGEGAYVRVLLGGLRRHIVVVTLVFTVIWVFLYGAEKWEESSIEDNIRKIYENDKLSSKSNIELFNHITDGMSRRTHRADFDKVIDNMLTSKRLFSKLECVGSIENSERIFIVELYTIAEPINISRSVRRC